jgi:hypothetical protein
LGQDIQRRQSETLLPDIRDSENSKETSSVKDGGMDEDIESEETKPLP